MTDLEPEPGHHAEGRSRLFGGRRQVVITCLLAFVGMGLLLSLRPGRSLEARLRAIDAAYAIPDEQNAAKAYTELTWGYSGPDLDLSLVPKDVWAATLAQPWRSADYPQVAKWLEDRRSVVDSLMNISRKPDCRFSIVEAYREAPMRSGAARQMFPLLLRAANNDLGEGRTEAGLEKLLGALRVARHFRTQISPWDNDVGRTILWRSLQRFDRLVMTEDVPQEWLTRFEAALPPADGGWNRNDKQMEAAGWLCDQERQRGTIKRLTNVLTRARASRIIRELDLLELGRCRVARILLALRRYRNEAGTWPGSLREVESRVPPEVLIDPVSGKPFAYRPTDDGVFVYSVGLNRVDEDGIGGDDFFLWPN
jgi:hypothetical protein